VRNGGFPPLLLDPIDFMQLYQQRLSQAQRACGVEPGNACGYDAARSSGLLLLQANIFSRSLRRQRGDEFAMRSALLVG